MVPCVKDCLGLARSGKAGMVRFDKVWVALVGQVRLGLIRSGEIWYGRAGWV